MLLLLATADIITFITSFSRHCLRFRFVIVFRLSFFVFLSYYFCFLFLFDFCQISSLLFTILILFILTSFQYFTTILIFSTMIFHMSFFLQCLISSLFSHACHCLFSYRSLFPFTPGSCRRFFFFRFFARIFPLTSLRRQHTSRSAGTDYARSFPVNALPANTSVAEPVKVLLCTRCPDFLRFQ